jgi:hypothetical protein
VQVNEEEKRRIIDLYFNQDKTIREVSRIMGKSSHDITPVTKEHRIRLAQIMLWQMESRVTLYNMSKTESFQMLKHINSLLKEKVL